MRRFLLWSALGCASVLLTGCPKGDPNYHAGRNAEDIQDYDTALVEYQRALRADPSNLEYKVKVAHLKFIDAQFHVDQGKKALDRGDLQTALAEYQKAQTIDPSNATAQQQVQHTMELLAAKSASEAPKPPTPPEETEVLAGPPQLKPISREPINLTMTNDAKIIFETIGKLAGLSVIFDPDFSSRRITAELPNVTLEQALDAVSLESKAFWKPISSNIIFVAPDQPQKRKDVEDEVVRTFYLSNTLTPQDITEIITGLRQTLNLTRVQQINSQNAIIIRDTPDKVLLAARILHTIDKAKPEVLLHVQVLETRLDRLHDLGILPGQSASVQFTPRTALSPSSTSTTTGTGTTGTTGTTTGTNTTTPLVTLNNLKHLGTADYSINLPGAAANAILTDTSTRILQDPEVRMTDGEQTKLRIGDRVPIATGSFQAGVGVGSQAGAGLVNPLVNTQFTYLDVGVNVDVTPRVHPDGDVSLKESLEVSSVTGEETIGGIQQPVISQRKIENEVRLKEGESNIIGGLITRNETKTLNGWPGLAHIPFLRYFVSDDKRDISDDEVMIMITPHIIRLPSIDTDDLRALAAGTDTNVRVYRSALDSVLPDTKPGTTGAVPPASGQPAVQLRFEPATVALKPGETATVGLTVTNVQDLFAIPVMLQYNPAVIQIDEVRNGGFLSGGTQEIAVVQRVDQQRGQAIVSAMRQPNSTGINGSGTIFGIVIHAVAAGSSQLQVVQVNAKDSQQKVIPMVSNEASINVQ
ncbi:MAG TPA: cohesin domain-containing protein [Candidatus Acidoferrales bacterium]|nr:cohesin domain-containing protein [Candidatus Acidoferrales bacterium]